MSVKEKSSQQISGRLQEGQQENTKTILIPYEQINSFYCKNSVKMDWSGISRPVLFSTASAKQGVSLPNHRKAGNER